MLKWLLKKWDKEHHKNWGNFSKITNMMRKIHYKKDDNKDEDDEEEAEVEEEYKQQIIILVY